MKNLLFDTIFIVLIFYVFSGCQSSINNQVEDDRIVKSPFFENKMDEMITICKQQSDIHRNPYHDTTLYFATFNFYSSNDTDKVQVMGRYEGAFVFHDSLGWNKERFLGFFKNKKFYCLFYQNLFVRETPSEGNNHFNIVNGFLQGWRLRDQSENPDIFVKDISVLTQDPYMFEYMIDSIGNYTLLRKGYW